MALHREQGQRNELFVDKEPAGVPAQTGGKMFVRLCAGVCFFIAYLCVRCCFFILLIFNKTAWA